MGITRQVVFLPINITRTLALTLTKLCVVEQDVTLTGTKSLGYYALGHDVLGQDVGHPYSYLNPCPLSR